jgi:hypothetical protein
MTEAEYQSIKAAPLPEAKYADHQVGEVIRSHAGGNPEQIAAGEILFIQQTGQVGSVHTPLTYYVEVGGFPECVWPTDVIEAPE